MRPSCRAVTGDQAGGLAGLPGWLPCKALAVWLQGCSAVGLPAFPGCWAAALPGSLSQQITGSLPTEWAQCWDFPAALSSAGLAGCSAGWGAAGLGTGGSGQPVCGSASTGRQLAWGDRLPTPSLVGMRNVCMPGKTFLNISPGRETETVLHSCPSKRYFPAVCQTTKSLSLPKCGKDI